MCLIAVPACSHCPGFTLSLSLPDPGTARCRHALLTSKIQINPSGTFGQDAENKDGKGRVDSRAVGRGDPCPSLS